jgi:hypothetical protein
MVSSLAWYGPVQGGAIASEFHFPSPVDTSPLITISGTMRHEETSSGGGANGWVKQVPNGNPPTVERLAVSPNLPNQIPNLLQKVASGGYEYLATGDQARLKLLEEARALVYALETPREAIIRHCWSEVRVLFPIVSATADILTSSRLRVTLRWKPQLP